jgi:hypothetical protein
MKARLLMAAVIFFVLALAVVAITSPSRRIYWPLYLPLGAALVALLAMSRK